VALSILYLHVARLQGWEAEGLAFPGHFLIRVGIDGARHVVDPFHDGTVRDAADLRGLLRQVLGPDAELHPRHFDPVSDRDVLLRLENNVRLRLAKREDWAGAAQSLERMLVIAPDRPGLLFEAGQLNARLDKRRAAIAAFERFLGLEGDGGDPGLRQRASALLQELRRGLN
jgi:regulator of sirC expression with transglutaminase-like and TPR domain